MIIGTMNHPAKDVMQEIDWMAEMGLEFVDLTLEAPASGSWQVNPDQIRKALERYGMGVVGHSAWYIPLASPIEELRQAALAEMRRCVDVFSAVGASWMNVHADRHTPWHEHRFMIEHNLRSLRELLPYAQEKGVGLMIENLPGAMNNAKQLGELLDPVPELGLHLDMGHANLRVEYNTTDEILAAYGHRLKHVHLHDNKGGEADLHLPLGAGTLDVAECVRTLKATGYDGTITLEVFTPDKHFLQYSRKILRRLWDSEPVQ